MGVGFMPNHLEPAVLSCCFRGPFRKDEEKDVGIFPPRPVLFWIAMDEGVFTFFAATAGSKAVSSFLLRMEIGGLLVVESSRVACLRSSARLFPVMPLNDLASSHMGAVYPGMR